MFSGEVTHLHICPRAFLPMQSQEAITLVAGKGIEGDRYMLESGFYSDKPEIGRQITLFEIETLEALKRDFDLELAPEEHRRNVTVKGVPLNHLVYRQFRLGSCLLEATRLSFPCKHLDEITGKDAFDSLVHRSGLNCMILEGGTVRVGDTVTPA